MRPAAYIEDRRCTILIVGGEPRLYGTRIGFIVPALANAQCETGMQGFIL